MLTITGIDEVQAAVGRKLGVSSWHQVTQAQIDAFAEVTDDRYWLHTDPERAADSEMGGTIAHGLYTLSREPAFRYEIVAFAGLGRTEVNYGYNRVRFPTPVPAGSRIRMHSTLQEVHETPGGGAQITLLQTMELEGQDRPACVIEALLRFLP